MLKILIKRDGSEEPVISSKLNRWNEWGSEHLNNRVEYSTAALHAIRKMPEKATTRELMLALINELLDIETWPAYLMAGRLFATVIRKDIYGSMQCPTIQQQHKNLVALGLMKDMGYSDSEYVAIEKLIDHNKDFFYPEFALKQIRDKYAIRNHATGDIYETPQFTYMRMAMELSSKEKEGFRITRVKEFYDALSDKGLSAPTPNYLYLGTKHDGLASCCIFTSADDSESLAIGDHIAYKMTVNSAGLGSFISTRNAGDPIDKGRVEHAGIFKYLKANAAATVANKQAARAGAGTTSFMAFHPQATEIVQYRNPLLPIDKQLRDLHFSMLSNQWFASKVSKGEDIFTFTEWSAPDLFDAFFSPDIKEFVRLYRKYEADDSFKKTYISARKLVMYSFGEAFDTGTAYLTQIDEANRHTPFKITKNHRIHSANLCQEVFEIQAPYYSMLDLYSKEDHGRGEIAMCSLAAIPIDNVITEEDYAQKTYLALKMIDYTIENSTYPFPHVEFTAKQRMNAGVGIMGFATHMARKGLSIMTDEGMQEAHAVFERHMWHLIQASIKISKERGLAPWIHKTKWPEGWTPLSTYNRNIDTIQEFKNNYDWDAVSKQLIENGGLAHSVLCNMMPGESSSKALGSSNSIYFVRKNVITKTDGESNILRWAAVDGDLLGDAYEKCWDIPTKRMIQFYGVCQKWVDQGISADLYRKFAPGEVTVSEQEVVETFLWIVQYGLKSRYYTNTLRPKVKSLDNVESLVGTSTEAVEKTAFEIVKEAGFQGDPEAFVARLTSWDGISQNHFANTEELGIATKMVGVVNLDKSWPEFLKNGLATAREAYASQINSLTTDFIGTAAVEPLPTIEQVPHVEAVKESLPLPVLDTSLLDTGVAAVVEYEELEIEDSCGSGVCKL